MATKSKKPLTPMVSFGADRDEKRKALKTAMKQIEKDFGEGAIMKLGENQHMAVQAVHTGSLSLDMALGIGGVPRGRIIEIFGPESSGKTTVALHIVAEVQKAGGEAAFIDAEHALDPVYAKALGVDTDNLLVSQPDCGEDALSICESLVRSGAVDVVVCDGFSGNVLLKSIEGTAMYMGSLMKHKIFKRNFFSKIGYLLCKAGVDEVMGLLDYRTIGGTQFLGIKKPVIKAHGSSDALAFRNAIRQAEAATKADFCTELEQALAMIKETTND